MGSFYEFDISKKVCHQFGFYHGDVVMFPWSNSSREASVIGVYKNNLWFHINGDLGATYFGGYRKIDFEKQGFKLIRRGPKDRGAE